MVDEHINPGVTKSLADMDGERIAERSSLDYARNFWSSYKNGHYRFALAGVAIVAPLAAVMGLVAAHFLLGVALLSIPALVTAAAFTAAGSLMATEGFGATGAATASRAAGLAEKHARILDADTRGKSALDATDDKLMYDGRGQHFEFPTNRDTGKFYSLKSGLTGGIMGTVCGAVIGLGGGMGIPAALTTAMAHTSLAATLATSLTAAGLATAAPMILAGAVTFGLFGLTFGLERKVLKTFFNQTDANVQGNLTFKNGPDLGRAQSLESDHELLQHRLRRQEEINRLEKEYNNRIFWGALGGRFKGFAGGIPGAAIGAAVGALLVGGLMLATVAVPLGAAGMIAAFACGGGLLGMDVFAQSGMEAGAEATARAIDNEFERNRALRARGITPPAPKEPENAWFSGKSLILCAAIGAIVGLAIAPAFGVGIVNLVALVMSNASIATGVTALSGKALLASSLVGTMVGATYGLGGKSIQGMAKPFTSLYDKVIFRHDAPGLEKAPLLQTQPATPAVHPQITPEEMAQLNERLNAGNGKNFTQLTQQLQPTTATVGV